jgi:hypothetical protein
MNRIGLVSAGSIATDTACSAQAAVQERMSGAKRECIGTGQLAGGECLGAWIKTVSRRDIRSCTIMAEQDAAVAALD